MAGGGIEGLDKLMKKYGQLAEQISGEAMERAVSASIKKVQDEAKLLCPVNYGELRNSIKTVIEQQGEGVTGTVYTNKAYATFVEFGTGPKGEKDHLGISPAVTPAYSQKAWWIHESQIDKKDAERYGWFYIDTKKGRFYQTSGQPAHPFMYPALKNNEERVNRNIANYLSREIRKAVQD